jgi:hypothetical protein
MSKNIRSGMTPTRSNSPDKFHNLNDSVWHKLMQLEPELAQDIQENRVRQHVKTSSKEILKK